MKARLARWNREAARQVLHGLVLYALVLLLVPTAQAAVWQCEGRECGVTPWVCCCEVPDDRHGPVCGSQASARDAHRQSDTHRGEVSACAQACHCVMVMQDGATSLHTAVPAYPVSLEVVAVLPTLPRLAVPAAVELRLVPPRGPPPRSFFRSALFGRAPPIS